MKMSKNAAFLGVLGVLLCFALQAQKKEYVSVNVGYSAGMGDYGRVENVTVTSSGSFTNESVKQDFGQGLNLGITYGKMHNGNFGIEVGLAYHGGAAFVSNSSIFDDSAGVTNTYKEKNSVNMIRVNPRIVISMADRKFNPYAKFGIIWGYGTLTSKGEQIYYSDFYTQTLKASGTCLGLSGSLGGTAAVSAFTDFFIEVSSVNMNFIPKKGRLVEAHYNGMDVLGQIPDYYKEVEFVDHIEGNTMVPALNGSNQTLKRSASMSSVGVNIGFRFRF